MFIVFLFSQQSFLVVLLPWDLADHKQQVLGEEGTQVQVKRDMKISQKRKRVILIKVLSSLQVLLHVWIPRCFTLLWAPGETAFW